MGSREWWRREMQAGQMKRQLCSAAQHKAKLPYRAGGNNEGNKGDEGEWQEA